MPLLPLHSRIHRVRTVTRDVDRGTVRRRLDRALRSADFEPAGLPAGSLLCVRRLADPLPGRLGSPEREIETNARWSQAVRDSLATILSTAARPRGGRLAEGAEAVLFPNEADLLACFALAQAEGRVGREWWWPCALPAADLHRPWPELWGRNPTAIPAALHCLAAGSCLPVVLGSLTANAAGPLNRQLAITHGLPELLQVLAPPAATIPGSVSLLRPETGLGAGRPAIPEVVSAPASAVRDFLPEITPQEMAMAAALPRETGLFVLFGLLLARNPARVRRAEFASFVRRVLNGSQSLLPSASPAAASPPDVSPGASAASTLPAPARPARSVVRPSPPATFRLPRRKDDSSPTPAALPPIQVATPGTSPRPPAPPIHAASPLPGSEMTVSTAHGGIFYLLNLALVLGLYGDFTQPLRRGLALSPWEFLDRLGRRLLPDDPRVADDPLWSALARLAGPPAEPPAPIVPAGWEPDPAWGDPQLVLPPAARSSIDDFLPWLIPVLSGRLKRAGVAFPLLLGGFARVVVTSGRVEVYFSLSSHPIEIRIAGLDRDPGWIPAAGRDVRFHYD